MKPNLIYDVGMNNGDDTAYYLHCGYDVVAVEADPSLVNTAQSRFAKELKEGRLRILDCAIASEIGETEFWLCDELNVWNSFDKDMAGRQGKTCRPIKVRTRPLSDVMAEFGVPHYLKIDIEGYDHIAATDINADDSPDYVSMEIGSVDDFFLLKSKGYKRFKCIEQTYLTQVTSPKLNFKNLRTVATNKIKTAAIVNQFRTHYHRLTGYRYSPPVVDNWTFLPTSSGPFGESTPGVWMSMEEALHAWLSEQLGYELGYRATSAKLGAWYDLHAAK